MKIVTLIVRLLLGASIRRVWAQWLFEFPEHGAGAYGSGRTVYRRTFSVALLLGNCCATNLGRRAVAGKSFCAAGVSAAWPSDRKHSLVSCVPESGWHKNGNYCDDPLVHCFLQQSPALLRDLCATDIRL
jgi:hypothetical protein